MNLLKLDSNERRNLALLAMFGGAVVFTVFAATGLCLVHTNLQYVFWLALAAHAQLLTIMTGFIAQLVKRRITAGKDGITISDNGEESVQIEQSVKG